MSELGQALKDARMAKGMTLDDVQDLTKIQKRYLAAIESGEYDKLPGNFYTRAFMKSYAEAVDLDPKELFSEYSRELPQLENEVEIAPSRSRSQTVSPRESKIVNLLPKILIVAVCVVVLVGIWLLMQKLTSGESDSAKNKENGVVIKNGPNIGNGKTVKKKAKDTDSSTQSDDKKKEDTAKEQTSESQQLTLDNSSGQESHYTLTGTDRFDVEIDAKDGKNSWIQVSKNGPTGEKLYYSLVSKGMSGTQDASFHQDLSSVDTVYIKVGNALNTVIKINGQDFSFPNSGTVQKIYINYKKTES
ncbi:MAG: helix-turn-helix domain-containing protein [Tuberibacillus sp.]